ncbi:MAG: hypothetical protein P1U41_01245 [Vicingaceae bacterium]|nr:hypothetical protein [Vicingaceae bacterium]
MLDRLSHVVRNYKNYFYKFSWQLVLHYKLNEAYKKREWEKFDMLLQKKNPNSIVYRSWFAMKQAYFMKLNEPELVWKDIHELASKKKHFLALFAFRNYIYALIGNGNISELKLEIEKFDTLYKTYCPLIYLPGVCAMFVHKKEYKDCLELLDIWREGVKDENVKKEFVLKSYPYYAICKRGVSGNYCNDDLNVTEGLLNEMKNFYLPGSPAKEVFDECLLCWDEIKKSQNELLMDMRYEPSQTEALRAKVKNAVIEKKSFMLLRVGDGEAYAVADSSKEHQKHLEETLEQFWWGVNLDPELRKSIISDFKNTFSDADVIGMPYSIRLSQILTKFIPGSLNHADIRLKVLYHGMTKFLKNNEIKCSVWTDEYCNYAFVDEKYLSEIIALSTNVVLVTCFDIPEGNIFNNDKVKVVHSPPVKKISKVDNVVDFDKSLPEIINDLKVEVSGLVKEGTLVLLSAGFAGKPILKVVKDKGGVAIDFGSSIDHIMGYRTRNMELHSLFSD